MKRREALQLTATAMGCTILGAEVFLSGCKPKDTTGNYFSKEDILLMDEIGETILPHSDRSPGAKAAQIGLFMETIVTDCYDEKEKEIFSKGLEEVNKVSKEKYNKVFLKITSSERHELLSQLDEIARNRPDEEEIHFYAMMKQLTIWGYFTSEPGATKALRYNPTPGYFKGCVDYKTGDKAWA